MISAIIKKNNMKIPSLCNSIFHSPDDTIIFHLVRPENISIDSVLSIVPRFSNMALFSKKLSSRMLRYKMNRTEKISGKEYAIFEVIK